MAEGEDKVGNHVQRHTGAHQVNQVTAVDQASRHNAVQNQARCNQGVEPAGAANAEFLGIKGDVVGNRTVGESYENEVGELRNGASEEEPVKRKRCMRFFLFARHIQRLHKNQADNAQNNRNRKDDGVAERLVQEHAGHGACRERQVHADAEVADAFTAAACGQGVDGDRVARRARNSEEQTMRKSHRGKNRQYADRLVA